MRGKLQHLLIACGFLLATMAPAADTLTLENAPSVFANAKSGENCASLLVDGWRVALLSHNGKEIGAAIVMEQEDAEDHEHDLQDTISRIAELAGMTTPESLDFEEAEQECALLVDQDVLGELAEETDHVFDGSPLAALAYLLNEEYFCINSIRSNGFIHWKTIKKSGVELLMPMAEKKLSAIEVTGRQQMNDFASEVLADKLGLGKNTVPPASREALCPQLRCTQVPYMNAKSNILLARTDRRAVIGKRQAAARLLANRNEGAIPEADQESTWPAEEEEVEEPTPEPEKKEEPLTPEAAREAYIKYVQSL